MNKFISQAEFASLNTGDKLIGNGVQEPVYEVSIARCGGPGAYPTHLFITETGNDFIFHDGVSIRYDSNDKELDGNVVGELNDKNYEAFGKIRCRKHSKVISN